MLLFFSTENPVLPEVESMYFLQADGGEEFLRIIEDVILENKH